jgi:hypothetical protein
MDAYRALTAAGTPTRVASRLTGISRACADRDRRRPTPAPGRARPPANALTPREQAAVLAALDSPEYVDAAPAQIYAALLDQGIYLGSISTMYRILREHDQVKERRRQARHPAAPARNWSPRPPGRSTAGTSRNWPVRSRAATTTPT